MFFDIFDRLKFEILLQFTLFNLLLNVMIDLDNIISWFVLEWRYCKCISIEYECIQKLIYRNKSKFLLIYDSISPFILYFLIWFHGVINRSRRDYIYSAYNMIWVKNNTYTVIYEKIDIRSTVIFSHQIGV